MANLRLKNIKKSFAGQIALDNLNLDIEDGEFFVILGHTGAGKTTILRCIAGLEQPEQGEIYMDDELISNLSPATRDVAFVFQEHILYPHMTVYENMAFPLRPRGHSDSEINSRVVEIAEMLHIKHLLGREPSQLSGGETQRVGLGRAMVRQPKVFLMDEPISALDAKLRAEMRAEIKWRQRQTGITTLYVTHDQTEAMSMADRIAILKDGDVMQVGTATEVYHSPANLFVADFIGNPSINLIPCKVSAFEDEYMQISLLDHLQYQITEAEIVKQLARMDRDCELILGIHPEDISLEDIGLEDRQNMDDISAEIYESEPLGAETIVDLNLGKSERGEMVILKVRTSPDFDKAVGQMVAIKFDQKQLFFFDAITGEAIR